MNHRVYIAASTQKENIGVGLYGNEEARMMYLADRIKYWLGTQVGKFTTFRNQHGWTLQQTVADCNKLSCDLFIDNHSNADSSIKTGGTEVFYYHQSGTASNSYRLASALYNRIAPISPGSDRGILPDNTYTGSIYVIQQTDPPAALVEHFFHSNPVEVADYLAKIDTYAKAEAMATCDYCGEKWDEPLTPLQSVELLVNEMIKDGIVTDKVWIDVLMGKVPANPSYLQIAFRRATEKIK